MGWMTLTFKGSFGSNYSRGEEEDIWKTIPLWLLLPSCSLVEGSGRPPAANSIKTANSPDAFGEKVWNASPGKESRLAEVITEGEGNWSWEWMKWSESCSAVSDSLWPHGLYSPWNPPGQNTGGGSLSLSPGDLPNPGIKPRSPALQADS